MNEREIKTFNILTWSDAIPLCDDVWLGMQARNIAMVDMSIIRHLESEALEAYTEAEKTPVHLLLPLSALSQMWVFSLYEFLRTWRQRAGELLDIASAHSQLPAADQGTFLAKAVTKAEKKEELISVAIRHYAKQVAQVSDAAFVRRLETYKTAMEELFRSAEALRVTLAKHEVPKTKGLIAEAPGYGRMSYLDGSMSWQIVLKDSSLKIINRRSLSNEFLGIDDE